MIDTSSHRDGGSAGADFHTIRDLGAEGRLWGESFSGRLFSQGFEESLLLLAGQELVVAIRNYWPTNKLMRRLCLDSAVSSRSATP